MWTVPSLAREEVSVQTLKKQMERKKETVKYLYETQREVEATCRRVLYHTRSPMKALHPRKRSSLHDSDRRQQKLFSSFHTSKELSSSVASSLNREQTDYVPRRPLSRAGKVSLQEVKFGAKPWEADDFVPSADPHSLPTEEHKETRGFVEPITVEQFAKYKDHFAEYSPPCKPLGLALGPRGWKLQDPFVPLQLPIDVPLASLTPALRAQLQADEAALRVKQYNIFSPTSF